jgi:hypothetical protein
LIGAHAPAAVSPDEASHLGKDLTPAGGEKVGNKDGSIPAWDGKDPPPAGWTWGKNRKNFWKFKDEKPLFTVTPENMDKYASGLSPNQMYALKTIKGFTMDVYPSHRNCGMPAVSEKFTLENATEAKMAADGSGLAHAKAGGVPFPIPKTGAEAMWNALLRVNGVGFEYQKGFSIISPRPGTDEFSTYQWKLYNYWPGGRTGGQNVEDDGGYQFLQYYAYSAPPALAGQALLALTPIDREIESYYYYPGQRRVRRMPAYVFDTPLIGFENEYLYDEEMMLFTSLLRYDYKLAGKRELFIQNDAFGGFDIDAKQDDVFKKDIVNPAYRHYERHRVWVVEATVKEGARHIYPHRTYYLDEDTWDPVVIDDYDVAGKPAKLREASQIPVWELGGTCSYGGYVMYNFTSGRYLSDYTVVTQGTDMQWYQNADKPFFTTSFYTPESLRAMMER